MIDGMIIQYECSWGFLKKKHLCFECGAILQRRKREIVVNSESEEAKKYDFSSIDTYMCGNIKFITYYFQCPVCGTIYEIRDLKRLYKQKKLEKKQNKKLQKKLKKMR